MTNLQITQKLQKKLSPRCRHLSIGERLLSNLQFVDDIDLLGCSEEELQQLTERLEKTAAGYGVEIISDKSKILVNSI